MLVKLLILIIFIKCEDNNIKWNINDLEFDSLKSKLIDILVKKIIFPIKLNKVINVKKGAISGNIKNIQIKKIDLKSFDLKFLKTKDNKTNVKFNLKDIEIYLEHNFKILLSHFNGYLNVKTDIYLEINIINEGNSHIHFEVIDYKFGNFNYKFSTLGHNILFAIINIFHILQNKLFKDGVTLINSLIKDNPIKDFAIKYQEFKINLTLNDLLYNTVLNKNYINLCLDVNLLNKNNKKIKIEKYIHNPNIINNSNILIGNKIISYLIFILSKKIKLNANTLLKNQKITGELLSMIFDNVDKVIKDESKEVLIDVSIKPYLNLKLKGFDEIYYEKFIFSRRNEIFLKNYLELKLYTNEEYYCTLSLLNMINIFLYVSKNKINYKYPNLYLNKILNDDECKFEYNENKIKNVIKDNKDMIETISGSYDLSKILKKVFIENIDIILDNDNFDVSFKLN